MGALSRAARWWLCVRVDDYWLLDFLEERHLARLIVTHASRIYLRFVVARVEVDLRVLREVNQVSSASLIALALVDHEVDLGNTLQSHRLNAGMARLLDFLVDIVRSDAIE